MPQDHVLFVGQVGRQIEAAAKPPEIVSQEPNGSGNGRGDGGDKNVAVLDVGQFVRHDAGDLVFGEHV